MILLGIAHAGQPDVRQKRIDSLIHAVYLAAMLSMRLMRTLISGKEGSLYKVARLVSLESKLIIYKDTNLSENVNIKSVANTIML